MLNPFGEESCEKEVKVFGDRYSELYFYDTPFNDEFMDARRYLVIGRRGTGKTSLAQFLSFQERIDNARLICADKPELYGAALNKLAADQPDEPNELVIPRIRKIWEYLIWQLLFHEYIPEDLRRAAPESPARVKPSGLIRRVAETLVEAFLTDGRIASDLEDRLNADPLDDLKEKTLRLAKRNPALVAIDALEHYSVDNEPMMRSVAALISAASDFNSEYSHRGIHIKVFLAGEVFPYVLEKVVENPGKHVRAPLWLHWRPRDLIRLVCWRYYQYLIRDGSPNLANRDIDWSRFSSVKESIWIPYFGAKITNRLKIEEECFAYVLRHTQMRPRQLVYLCNQIAHGSKGSFPSFPQDAIRSMIHERQSELASDVLNAYASTYPGAEKIVNALVGLPKIFRGNELDRVAPKTASQWPRGQYSPSSFRELVAELGIVGRVRHYDDKTGIADADFEYSLDVRLALQSDDLCAIHPMFYTRLHTTNETRAIVYPFPDRPDFDDVRH